MKTFIQELKKKPKKQSLEYLQRSLSTALLLLRIIMWKSLSFSLNKKLIFNSLEIQQQQLDRSDCCCNIRNSRMMYPSKIRMMLRTFFPSFSLFSSNLFFSHSAVLSNPIQFQLKASRVGVEHAVETSSCTVEYWFYNSVSIELGIYVRTYVCHYLLSV